LYARYPTARRNKKASMASNTHHRIPGSLVPADEVGSSLELFDADAFELGAASALHTSGVAHKIQMFPP